MNYARRTFNCLTAGILYDMWRQTMKKIMILVEKRRQLSSQISICFNQHLARDDQFNDANLKQTEDLMGTACGRKQACNQSAGVEKCSPGPTSHTALCCNAYAGD